MGLANKRIGLRLYLGCGVLMVAVLALIAFGFTRLSSLGNAQERIVGVGWAKAEAAHTINALTRANARRVLELFLATDKDQIAQTTLFIESNKQVITEKLEQLDRMTETKEEKTLMAAIRQTRVSYVASFSKVMALLAEDRRGQAAALMNRETLPTLDKLQKLLEAMLALQKSMAEESAADARHDIVQAGVVMFGLCLIGLLASMGMANLVARRIRQRQRLRVGAAANESSLAQDSSTPRPS